jgi:hypothetical protein
MKKKIEDQRMTTKELIKNITNSKKQKTESSKSICSHNPNDAKEKHKGINAIRENILQAKSQQKEN